MKVRKLLKNVMMGEQVEIVFDGKTLVEQVGHFWGEKALFPELLDRKIENIRTNQEGQIVIEVKDKLHGDQRRINEKDTNTIR